MKKYIFGDQWIFYKANSENRQTVNLPHDAMILEERDPNCPSGSAGAFFPGGRYCYEKKFQIPESWDNKHMLFVFEGVYQNAIVYINGVEAGGNKYGYTPFTITADEFIKIGQENTIQVLVDNSKQPNSRWYSGSGIYRPVWMYLGDKSHIAYQGIKIATLSYEPAKIQVETQHSGGQIDVDILYNGKVVTSEKGDSVVIEIPDAKLWNAEEPTLYECRVILSEKGKVLEEKVVPFGIRTVTWSNKGIFINGKEVLLRGGCVHHDNGLLGAKCYPESEERRVRIMKQAGYNALRIAHNPASKAMLEACDKYGMYVMDETWDMWYKKKTAYDYSECFENYYMEDIKAMVERDFNHPSVIMYSIGNEVTEPVQEKGLKMMEEMTALTHSLDSGRAVTCGLNLWLLNNSSKGEGVYDSNETKKSEKSSKQPEQEMNSTLFNMIASQVGTSINNGAISKEADEVVSPCIDILDIAGYNYSSGRYELEGSEHPDRVVVGAETYPQDIYKNWEMVKRLPYLIGDFVWTCWDYLGEAGLGAWAYSEDGMSFNKPYPWILADTGTIDILGNIGAQADYAAVVWGVLDKPAIHVQPVNHADEVPAKMVWRGTNAIPSWSWKGCEGKKAVIEVYSNASFVELMIDDKSIDLKPVKECRAIFEANYIAGTLTAIAYDNDRKKIGQSILCSGTGKSQIQIIPEKRVVASNEIFYVNINIAGQNGIVESNDDHKLTVKIVGGELLAFGSANPRTEERYHLGSFTTYFGRAQAVIRAGDTGQVEIHVDAEELSNTNAAVSIK